MANTRKAPPSTEHVEVVDLTYQLAAELWDVNPTTQRRIRRFQVKALTQAILAGEWRLTSSAIRVTLDPVTGRYKEVVNGQHRILARMEAGPEHTDPVPVLLFTTPHKPDDRLGHDPAFLVEDTGGGVRSWGDFCKIAGVPRWVQTAGVVRHCHNIDTHDGYLESHIRPVPSNKERIQWWYDSNQDAVLESVRAADLAYGHCKISRPLYGTWHYLAGRDVDEELRDNFHEHVMGRGSTDHQHPANRLAHLALQWNSQPGHMPQRILWYTILRGWHYYLAGETSVPALRWTTRNRTLRVVPEWWETGDTPTPAK